MGKTPKIGGGAMAKVEAAMAQVEVLSAEEAQFQPVERPKKRATRAYVEQILALVDYMFNCQPRILG